uniref:Uncharacterized protein n=1 Tax=Hucho hucho TaxID=62062 RepID=A0A4W5PMU3_9TELE
MAFSFSSEKSHCWSLLPLQSHPPLILHDSGQGLSHSHSVKEKYTPHLRVPLQRRHEQMKKNLEAQHKELEEKRRQLEDEKNNWEAQQRVLEQQKLDSSRYNTLLQHIHFYTTVLHVVNHEQLFNLFLWCHIILYLFSYSSPHPVPS